MPANNCRRDCQERFRVEGEDPRRRWPTAKAQGPAFTLSPLARPGKAVALEARIELWSASDHLVAFQFLKTILRDDERFQQSRYAGHNIVSTETGLAATGVFTCRRAVGVEVFLLTSPFIERLRRAKRIPEGCQERSPGVLFLFLAPWQGCEDTSHHNPSQSLAMVARPSYAWTTQCHIDMNLAVTGKPSWA